MRAVFMIMIFCVSVFSGCTPKNYVYSNASLNEAYPYDPKWDYKGYNLQQDDSAYRVYDPDRTDHLMKKMKARKM